MAEPKEQRICKTCDFVRKHAHGNSTVFRCHRYKLEMSTGMEWPEMDGSDSCKDGEWSKIDQNARSTTNG